jgi:hypothetical protein
VAEALTQVEPFAELIVLTAIETPPAHVRWGDIPTPMF